MASGIVAAFGGGDASSDGERKPNPVARFEVRVADTEKGTPTLQILAKRADGTGSKYQNLILYIDTADSLRAFAAALPTIAKAVAAVDAKQVALKAWPANPAAPAAPAAAPEQPAAPAKSKIASAFDDLPW